jgi:hypothetical protein
MIKTVSIVALGAASVCAPLVIAGPAAAAVSVNVCNDTGSTQNLFASSNNSGVQNLKLDANSCAVFPVNAPDTLTVASAGGGGSADAQHACGAEGPMFGGCAYTTAAGKFVVMQDGAKRYFTGDAVVPISATSSNVTIDFVSFTS